MTKDQLDGYATAGGIAEEVLSSIRWKWFLPLFTFYINLN